ncbi:zinc finger CCHC domain-containing protein 12-like [Syngnathus typhle]|uniref:zinc finger CCHC domain-containing protein 12-like n=1 Tax=Syngnathus typhle TaxID=161592 RepID=UPI002A69B806|nr:zinc finger CCHC domain-containing protein 12-like [Syngnathus typhle]
MNSATHSSFSELQKIARISGKSFEDVLHEHLSKCAQSIVSNPKTPEDMNSVSENQNEPTTTVERPPKVTDQCQDETMKPINPNISFSSPVTVNQPQSDQPSHIPARFLTPPEVQKVVVEHTVRSEAPVSPINSSFRLRQFSGKIPYPSHEVDFDTWRHSVELILQDPDLSDLHRSRKILDSLVSPAANLVKPLGPNALPSAYLELLNSAFGTVEDGDELFAIFLNTFQDPSEKPSHYLHRLQTALSKSLNRGGVVAGEADRHLLRQFCRGCCNNALLTDLQLGKLKDKPPTFTNLLLQLRVEEDNHIAKESRMKQHFAATRPKVTAQSIAASANISDPPMQTDLAEMQNQIAELQTQLTQLKLKKGQPTEIPQNDIFKEMRAQIAELQSHITKLQPQRSKKRLNQPSANTKTNPEHKVPEQALLPPQAASKRSKPWYCFQCGEDGHIISTCTSEPNPSLVAKKKKQLREKQSLWDKQNNQTPPLN